MGCVLLQEKVVVVFPSGQPYSWLTKWVTGIVANGMISHRVVVVLADLVVAVAEADLVASAVVALGAAALVEAGKIY